ARVLAGEDPARERRPRRDAEPKLSRHRQQLAFDRALEQGVFDLKRDQRSRTAERGDRLGLRTLPSGRVGTADEPDLAVTDEVVESAHRLLDWRRLIPRMHP